MPGYFSRPSHDDPIHSYLGSRPVQLLADINGPGFDAPAYRRTDAYNLFYRPNDIEHLLALWPTQHRYGEPGRVGILTTRSAGSGPFDDNAYAYMQALGEDVRIAVHRCQLFERMQVQQGLLSQELLQGGVT